MSERQWQHWKARSLLRKAASQQLSTHPAGGSSKESSPCSSELLIVYVVLEAVFMNLESCNWELSESGFVSFSNFKSLPLFSRRYFFFILGVVAT